MKCPKCGATIDAKDKECINCGSIIEVKNKELRWLVVFAVFFAIITITSCFDLYKNHIFKNYPETTAYLVSYTISRSDDDVEYDCNYKYEVDYVEYKAKETTSIKPSEGSTKKINYDPNNPSDYVLDVEGKITTDIISIVLFVISTIVTIYIRKALVKVKTEEQQKLENEMFDEPKSETYKQAYFKQFNTYIESIVFEEDKISEEYEQKCIDCLENLSDEEFNTFCRLTMEQYRKLEKLWEGQILPEDYENGNMIKDSAFAPDSEVIKHITPVNMYPHKSSDGICFSVDFDVTWDPEHGCSWTYDNGKLEIN